MARSTIDQPRFLPMTRAEMRELGWRELDVLLVSGDAHVDHPAFGTALLGRWLVAHGFRAGVVAQPRWDRLDDLTRLGRPRLLAGVSAGAVDSMLAHYTAFRNRRRGDAYTPGGRPGARPDRATLVYTGLLRRAFAGLPVVVGGIEASLRRLSHYDFWSDRLRRSVLLDSKADVLLYGMAERSLVELAGHLRVTGTLPRRPLAGSAVADRRAELPADAEIVVELPSHEAIAADPALLLQATLALERQVHHGRPWLVQRAAARRVVLAPPARPLSTAELDALHGLPFSRLAHPSHVDPVPAAEMIGLSVTAHRGCGGGCAFCSLALHQGRRVSSRSAGSIVDEVRGLTRHPLWRGSLSDVGGPTANVWGARCDRDRQQDCDRSSCLHPRVCRHLEAPQGEWIALLQRLSGLERVAHVRVASGVRHDLLLRDEQALRDLAVGFVGGQLKVAPEHVVDRVLSLMRKPGAAQFERFCGRFAAASAASGKQQYLVPYLMSGLPGCTDEDMRTLRRWLDRRRWRPRQVQCFVPTPGTVASAMFFAGRDQAGRAIPVARSDVERRRQHAILLGERR